MTPPHSYYRKLQLAPVMIFQTSMTSHSFLLDHLCHHCCHCLLLHIKVWPSDSYWGWPNFSRHSCLSFYFYGCCNIFFLCIYGSCKHPVNSKFGGPELWPVVLFGIYLPQTNSSTSISSWVTESYTSSSSGERSLNSPKIIVSVCVHAPVDLYV